MGRTVAKKQLFALLQDESPRISSNNPCIFNKIILDDLDSEHPRPHRITAD
jgi:hypothetical protein